MKLQMEQVNDPNDFERIVNNMINRILSVGDIDYHAIHAELHQMQKPVQFMFNPEILAKEMARVQGFKDRAVELLGILTESNVIHKHAVETLTKGWTRFSVEKSAEKREGDAILRMSQFSSAATDAEYHYRYALGVVKNMESQLDSLSRQIACIQIASKIHDPRFAYDSAYGGNEDKSRIPEASDRVGDKIMGWEELDA